MFSIDRAGKLTTTLQVEGVFTDVCIAEDKKLYALEAKRGIIMVYESCGIMWKKQLDIVIPEKCVYEATFYESSFVVKTGIMYVSLIHKKKLVAFDINGTIVQPVTATPQYTNICGIDVNGSLVMSNYTSGSIYTRLVTGAHEEIATSSSSSFGLFYNRNTMFVFTDGTLIKYELRS